MKQPPDIPGRPYTSRELKGMGVVLIVMGLLIAIYARSLYNYGAGPQMIHTKGGTELMPEIPKRSPMNQIFEVSGLGLAALGLIPLTKGFLIKK